MNTWWARLSTQIILSLSLVALLTAAAISLPAAGWLRSQLSQQAWVQVQQAERVTQGLFAAQRVELANLALLTAQRPTLAQLLAAGGDAAALTAYLRTLQVGAGLDAVVVCAADGSLTAAVGMTVSAEICAHSTPNVWVDSPATPPRAWIVAQNSLPSADFYVVVGIALDNDFMADLHAQTGLEHFLRLGDVWLAGSLPPDAAINVSAENSPDRLSLTIRDQRYYAAQIPLTPTGLQTLAALEVSHLTAAQTRLTRLLSGIIALSILGSLALGALLARRLTRPLAALETAAAQFSRGELATPVQIQTGVREINLLAQTIEQARSQLSSTLAELQAEKNWIEHLLESIVEGIVILDVRGRVIFFSSGAERITGLTRATAIGQSCNAIFHLADSAEPFSSAIPAPDRQRKLTLRLPSGADVVVAVTGARFLPPDAGAAQVALVFRDVSEEEAVQRLLGHFFANISHEFRTPLSALAASVELLLDQAPDLTPAELHELLTSLHLGIFALQTLVDNLLESASLETGYFHVSPRPCALPDIIAEADSTIRPLLHKHGQRLVIELPPDLPAVQADPRRLVQVLVNLLSNANKYGPDEAEIGLRVSAEKNRVRIAVMDSGAGIDPAQRGRLFHRFAKLNSQNTRSGMGLGLSIVKAVVEAHGGQVGIEDRPGGGSIVWFTLPTASALPARPSQPPSAEPMS